MGMVAGRDPKELGDAGWGIILAHDADPAILEALGELLSLRRAQAGRANAQRYREFTRDWGYRPGETSLRWLARQGVSLGPVDPDRGVPYYLLIAGGFEAIPYHFQAQLDVFFAVGRIHFDTPDEYARYARSVVAAETGRARPRRGAAVFGMAHPGDRHTAALGQALVEPVAAELARRAFDQPVELIRGSEATKARLSELLHSPAGPALLFTAGHGLAFPPDDPRRRRHQGALLCANWPGPAGWSGPIPPDLYFSADDLAPDVGLHGVIAFLYASYSAATLDAARPGELAVLQPSASDAPATPLIAALCQDLLSHPAGGALAAIGLADQLRSYTSLSDTAAQTQAICKAARQLLVGHPAGHALDQLNMWSAELASLLTEELENLKYGKVLNPFMLVDLWAQSNETRHILLVGDPAVRLPSPQSAA